MVGEIVARFAQAHQPEGRWNTHANEELPPAEEEEEDNTSPMLGVEEFLLTSLILDSDGGMWFNRCPKLV